METLSLLQSWKGWARRLKLEAHALYWAYRDPRVSRAAKVFAACVAAYAFSPIDLIPDPIPVLGYLDDLVLVPFGIALAVRMIPPEVLTECRKMAREQEGHAWPVSRTAAAVIVLIWVGVGIWSMLFLARLF